MKYFVIALALFSVVCVKAASMVTLHEMDINKIEAAINDPQTAYTKVIAQICKNCLQGNYATFDEVHQMVRKEVQALASNYYTPQVLDDRAASISKILADKRLGLRNGAFELAAKKPGVYDIGMYLHWPEHGLSAEGLYNAILSRLIMFNEKIEPKVALAAVSRIIEIGAVNNDIKTQKQDLQKLNRIYSLKVLKDKASWEPVCSQIRTALDTY